MRMNQKRNQRKHQKKKNNYTYGPGEYFCRAFVIVGTSRTERSLMIVITRRDLSKMGGYLMIVIAIKYKKEKNNERSIDR